MSAHEQNGARLQRSLRDPNRPKLFKCFQLYHYYICKEFEM